MIKLNTKYIINDGQGSIVFTQGKQNTINGNYSLDGKDQVGILNGKFEDNILKSTYHHKASNSVGLIHFIFEGDGFTAKWKQGFEPGTMRGSWIGASDVAISLNQNKDQDKIIIEIQIWGNGAEIVVGRLGDLKSNLNDAFDDTELELAEIMTDNKLRGQYDLPEWNEIDDLLHVYGPIPGNDSSNEAKVKILQNGSVLMEFTPASLLDAESNQALVLEENYFESDGDTIFSAVNSEKGMIFSGKITVVNVLDFDPKGLRFFNKEIMIDDQLISECIYKVTYFDTEIENIGPDSHGKELNMQLFN